MMLAVDKSFSIYQSYYKDNFLSDKSESDISWIGSLQAFFLFLFGAISGPLADRFGVKVLHYFYHTFLP